MKVLFDYQCFQMQKFGGVSNSYAQLIMQLHNCGVDTCIGMKDTRNVHLVHSGIIPKQPTFKRIVSGIERRGKVVFEGLRLSEVFDPREYNRRYSVNLLEKRNYDIFEPTFFDPYFIPYLNGKPFVTTVHDMILERLPEMRIDEVQKRQKKVVCTAANMLHCPSESTKRDIIELYGIDSSKIEVVYHGAPKKVQFNAAPLFHFPYILYVGNRRLYKNFVPFAQECSKLFDIYPDLHLVCTGIPFTKEETALLTNLHIYNKTHHRRVSDKAMANLYRNAVAFVYPSLYEGFGLPILEAFTYNCPILLTPYSCFPEIAGDAALYFEMKEGKSNFVDVFREFYSFAEEDRKNLIDKGTERLKLFSWEKSAKKLIDVYKQLI